MLNKKICRICKEYAWDTIDEEYWSRGEIFCWYNLNVMFTKIKEDPHEYCPYALEHVISEQKYAE